MSNLRLSHCVAVLAASSLLIGIAGTAHAKLIGFNGTLSIGLAGQPPIVATGSGNALLNGSVGGIGGHLATLQIFTNSVAVTGSAVVPITDPEVVRMVSLSGTEVAFTVSVRGTVALGTGPLRPISGASGSGLTQNVMPVPGNVRICILFAGCPSSLPIPLTATHGRFGGPVGVGIGGLITLGTFGKGGIMFSIYGQPWTVGTAVVTGVPTNNIDGPFYSPFVEGFVHGPASATSSAADIGGVIQLVTATRVVTTIGVLLVTPLLTTLRIHLVPEPGTFVLFGSGVVALGIAGRSRLRKK